VVVVVVVLFCSRQGAIDAAVKQANTTSLEPRHFVINHEKSNRE